MHQDYKDITDKLGTPWWWDECGVPRYAPFRPSMANDIYADEVVLFEIKCQACGRSFEVCASMSVRKQIMLAEGRGKNTLRELVERKSLFYRDPPNYGCCDVGPTMTSEPVRVIEFWVKNRNPKSAKYLEWQRVKSLTGAWLAK